MFQLTDLENNKTTSIETQSKIELTFSLDWISVNISVWSREKGVSLNSEWLTLKIDALPKNDLNQIGELKIEETTESEVIISGPYGSAFKTGDDMGFYYYVNQSQFPEKSLTVLRPVKKNLFQLKHESELEFHSFKIDLEIPLTTITARAWHEEPNPKERIEELKKFFREHFDSSLFHEPQVEDTGTCLLLTYRTAE
ncbi:MAG: hypothetical protein V4598_06485 [Bdellovibrionota bacterium]